ncbi:hypothetical protein K491DRAFT_679221 [Lophiostoma macrostomum CBS 122681]|uniref:F-box domain-containing protein n=1 Tax=Lophiostoma macrostomum CBS 122681 TaxID=1314788 RepID=A0A6A6T4L5_9PLEO|nr:hypothetical protein K491DRAFT_679221 [Lophiostoma macrostomum CBS 122681]
MDINPTATLLGIPPELRLMIYESLLVLDTPIRYCGLLEYSSLQGQEIVRKKLRATEISKIPMLAILLTCRTIYNEATKCFYGQNCFQLIDQATSRHYFSAYDQLGPAMCLLSWSKDIGDTCTSHLRNVVISLSNVKIWPKHDLEGKNILEILPLLEFQWLHPACKLTFKDEEDIGTSRTEGLVFNANPMNDLYQSLSRQELLRRWSKTKTVHSIRVTREATNGCITFQNPGSHLTYQKQFELKQDHSISVTEHQKSLDLLDLPKNVLYNIYRQCFGTPHDAELRSIEWKFPDEQPLIPWTLKEAKGLLAITALHPLMQTCSKIHYQALQVCLMHRTIKLRSSSRVDTMCANETAWIHELVKGINPKGYGMNLAIVLEWDHLEARAFDQVRINLDHLLPLAKIPNPINITVRLYQWRHSTKTGDKIIKENTFPISDVQASADKVLWERLQRIEHWDIDRAYLSFLCDGYGNVRAIESKISSKEMPHHDVELVQAVQLLTSFPDEPPKPQT